MNEIPAVILNIQRQPGANTIAVVDQIQKLLPQLTSTLPASVKVTTLTDLTTTIRASVKDVEFELLLTIGLVVMVIFFIPAQRIGDHHSERRGAVVSGGNFRRHVYARLQPEQSDADGPYHLDGFRGGRCDRDDREHHPLRRGRRSAARGRVCERGADRITIISLTISLIAVLIPLLFMGDIVGRLFREFAVTLARNDSGFRGGLAYADADDVARLAEAIRRNPNRDAFSGRPRERSTP